MADEWLNQALRDGDKRAEYADWINDNELSILEAYREHIDIDNVPDDFIQNYYEQQMEGDQDEN